MSIKTKKPQKIVITDQNYYKVLKILIDIGTTYKLLNKEQERAMIKKYRNNRPELNKLLVKHNVRIVMNIAKRYVYRPSVLYPSDMLIDGFYGLLIAAERFDIDRNIKFNTYATPWVFKYITAPFYSRSPEVGVNTISLNQFINGEETTEIGNLLSYKNYNQDYLDMISMENQYTNISSNTVRDILQDIINKLQLKEDSFGYAIIERNLMGKESLSKLSAEYNLTYAQATNEKRNLTKTIKKHLIAAGIENVSSVF